MWHISAFHSRLLQANLEEVQRSVFFVLLADPDQSQAEEPSSSHDASLDHGVCFQPLSRVVQAVSQVLLSSHVLLSLPHQGEATEACALWMCHCKTVFPLSFCGPIHCQRSQAAFPAALGGVFYVEGGTRTYVGSSYG